VGLLVLSLVFILTVAVGVALAKGVLTLVLHVVTARELPAVDALRIVVFVGVLIAFWSLAPAVVEGPAASAVAALLR